LEDARMFNKLASNDTKRKWASELSDENLLKLIELTNVTNTPFGNYNQKKSASNYLNYESKARTKPSTEPIIKEAPSISNFLSEILAKGSKERTEYNPETRVKPLSIESELEQRVKRKRPAREELKPELKEVIDIINEREITRKDKEKAIVSLSVNDQKALYFLPVSYFNYDRDRELVKSFLLKRIRRDLDLPNEMTTEESIMENFKESINKRKQMYYDSDSDEDEDNEFDGNGFVRRTGVTCKLGRPRKGIPHNSCSSRKYVSQKKPTVNKIVKVHQRRPSRHKIVRRTKEQIEQSKKKSGSGYGGCGGCGGCYECEVDEYRKSSAKSSDERPRRKHRSRERESSRERRHRKYRE